ncbi:hypothetical protein GCM10011511_40520 [Puia dinghuensis]|uniref:DoxX family protein n=1 Tax=Puia dinghuensis TaxID=1792502 RepID=A0A8J2UG66_9BACT|nr:hypothetical protein GCM10011511_40520 [Puia dinghuensis]
MFYAIFLIGIAGQSFYYAEFRPSMMPPWPSPIPGQVVLVYLCSLFMVAAAVALVLERQARTMMLLLGGLFLALVLFCHVPYKLFVSPGDIGSWTKALKELAYSGSAFVMAGSFPGGEATGKKEPALIRLLEKFIPFGGVFFSITLIAFGIDHFLYAPYVAPLVPDWIPGHLFWTYFAGVALIGGGAGIILEIRKKTIAMLVGIMIFTWFLVLHIPRAVVAPVSDKGNELTSVFESLGFSGVAFVIAANTSLFYKSFIQRFLGVLYH